MSDFDREAEREKLREQFERDKQKREQSERMSELLLKGATMTNKHCDTCGDPIFRHEGQEFCPTCHGPGQQQAAGTQPEAQQPAQESAAGEESQPPAEPQPDPTEAAQAATETPVPDPAETPDGTPTPEPAQPPRQPATQRAPAATGSDDLSAARASLTRSLATLAQNAEATDDLSRKREYLAAAREAAEALDAAERVGR
jgi:uncharacterized Zn finger protein (UPF0148 family)